MFLLRHQNRQNKYVRQDGTNMFAEIDIKNNPPPLLPIPHTCVIVVLISWGCHNKVPQTGLLTTEMYCLTVLKARSLKSKDGHGHGPSELSREVAGLVPFPRF